MEENPTHIAPQTQAQPTGAIPIHTPSAGPLLLLILSPPPQLRPLFKKTVTDPAQIVLKGPCQGCPSAPRPRNLVILLPGLLLDVLCRGRIQEALTPALRCPLILPPCLLRCPSIL
jgi:hypothetical protein